MKLNDKRFWMMLENTWLPLPSFVIVQHFNNTAGSGTFDRNGGTAIEGDNEKFFMRLF